MVTKKKETFDRIYQVQYSSKVFRSLRENVVKILSFLKKNIVS